MGLQGMGSIGAMKEGAGTDIFRRMSKNWLLKESKARVPYRGTVADMVFQMVGLRAGMGIVECAILRSCRPKPNLPA